jgi:hypothetical protein
LKDKPTTSAPPTGGKKAYHPPRLDTYGDIREIAKTVGKTGASDGALHAMNKTQ